MSLDYLDYLDYLYVPWYVSNVSLHNELKIATTEQTAATFYNRFHSKMANHSNNLIAQLHTNQQPGNLERRLKRKWPRDLNHKLRRF
jgi:hypothetical protein